MHKLDITETVFNDSGEIIDTHVHYNLDPFYPDWKTYWQQAQQKGVTQSVIPGVDIVSSERAVEIANQDDRLWALVGVHPSEAGANSISGQELNQLSQWLELPTVLGVGEIGLDYFRLKANDQASRQNQQDALQKQLALAQQKGGWLSLHVRDQAAPSQRQKGNAYWDTLEIVQLFNWDSSNHKLILHCVSGPKEYVQAMLELGAYLGFDGNLTYPTADDLRQLWQLVPTSKRLLETDAPYLPPQSYRGKTCEPWMISETARYAQDNLQA